MPTWARRVARTALFVLWRCVHVVWAALCAAGALRRRLRLEARPSPAYGAPRHLAVVVCEDSPPICELAKLPVWCLAASVRQFTFYDPSGILKKAEDRLFAAAEDFKGNSPGQICRPDGSGSRTNGYKNGTDRRITVEVLNEADGKKKIVSVVKNMCSDESLHPKDVTVERVDARFAEAYPSVSEPNLVVYFSEMCCTRGLLPWHIRLTEFFRLESYDRTLRLEDFIKLLNKYQKCEQRFGK